MKQGGSTVVSIPPYMLEHLGLKAGDHVVIYQHNTYKTIFLRPVDSPPLPLSCIPFADK
jgi:antitoxin component of MazEF toxin-antitoxin module